MKINSSLEEKQHNQCLIIISKLLKHWNQKDEVSYALLFSEDAEYTAVTNETYYGRDLIEEKHIFPFTTVNKDATLSFLEALIRKVSGNVIFLTVRWKVIGSIDLNGNTLPDRFGVINAILQYYDCEILISHLYNCDIGGEPFN